MLAFFIECACPPEHRSATVGAGDLQTVEEFLSTYTLTHIVCDACNAYFRLIGYIDEAGVERRVDLVAAHSPISTRRGGRAHLRSRL